MSDQPQPTKNQGKQPDRFPEELAELGRQIASIAASVDNGKELGLAYERVVQSVSRRNRILNMVQEALAQLRLDIKYLMFDLEVTRRERNELQEQIEELERDF